MDIAWFLVVVSKESRFGGSTEVAIGPRDWDSMRIPLLKFYPKHVDDLGRLADVLPQILREVAAGLREEGRIDLRSESDISYDEMMKRFLGGK